MATVAKRPLRIWRRDDTDTQIGNGGTADSGVAPSYGWEALTVFMSLPAGAGTLAIQQRLRAGSAWVTTDTFALGAAGVISDVAVRTGELVRAVFTNGATPQQPEIVVGLI